MIRRTPFVAVAPYAPPQIQLLYRANARKSKDDPLLTPAARSAATDRPAPGCTHKNSASRSLLRASITLLSSLSCHTDSKGPLPGLKSGPFTALAGLKPGAYSAIRENGRGGRLRSSR